jgi:hypothetical protein
MSISDASASLVVLTPGAANEALLPIENREPAHLNVPHVARHVFDVLILI